MFTGEVAPRGLPADAELLDRAAAHACEPMLGHDVRGAVRIACEGHVDNRRLSRALFAACAELGVHFEQSGEIALECDPRRVRGIRSERGFVATGAVVNAAGAWAGVLDGVPAAVRVAVKPIAGEMLALAVPAWLRSRAWSWCGRGHLSRPTRRRGRRCSSVRPSSTAASTCA